MSDDAKLRITEGLRKAREAKAHGSEIVASAPQEPAPAPADVTVPIPPRNRAAPGRERGRDIIPR